MKRPGWWLWLAKLLAFLCIQLFNFRIAEVALRYFNPSFDEPFLANRHYLFGNTIFKLGLMCHGIAACFCLFIFSILILFALEKKYKRIHKLLGRISLISLFLFVVPGGIILSYFAFGGPLGKFLFFMLSIYTAYTGFKGYSSIRKKLIKEHKRFMLELFWLLFSAIIFRLLLFAASFITSLDAQVKYNIVILISWLPIPLVFLFLKAKTPYNQFTKKNV